VINEQGLSQRNPNAHENLGPSAIGTFAKVKKSSCFSAPLRIRVPEGGPAFSALAAVGTEVADSRR
jgi:hypothetical protein